MINLSESLKQKMDIIADKLWSNHAALMVGAGFSKNVNEKFADWIELSDKMYEEIYDKKPAEEKNTRYLSTLKLAQEYKLSKGEKALNNLLKQVIPDNDYQPSELHKKILELPWVDVFTTNYDTLLERAAEDIYKIRYETIRKPDELINSTKPRIIKLHGSFPDTTPFIITEEDYRTYPKDFAPFVNTVQQSLIENVLCLIGFSGDDPNFMQWLGWIRDNLGENNKTKIYLIGALELSETKKEILSKKGIETIDFMDVFRERDDKHEKAISAFIDHLSSQNTLKAKLNWEIPADAKLGFRKGGDSLKQIYEQYHFLKEKHDSYPNWIICPKENRKGVQYYFEQQFLLDNWFLEKAQELEGEFDIHFLYEFNWLRETALYDLNPDIVKIIKVVLKKYDPFNTGQSEAKKTFQNDPDLNWNNIKKYWIELHLTLLKCYRKFGLHEEWLKVNTVIKKVLKDICHENFHAYQYEKCLYHLYNFDFKLLLANLSNWNIADDFTFWKAKKAGLLIEIGKYDDAKKLLVKSLKLVRSHLRLKPIKYDFRLPSEESYIMLLSLVIENIHLDKEGFEDFYRRVDELKDRWDELKKYRCDPRGEIIELNNYFRFIPPPHKKTYRTENFTLNQDSINHVFTSDKNMEKGFELLNLIEEIALPIGYSNLSVNSKATSNMISYISRNSNSKLLELSVTLAIRDGTLLHFDKMFGYQQIHHLSQKQSDDIATKYLNVIKKWRLEKDKFKSEYNRIDTYKAIGFVVPELLSRLCIKCSFEIKIKILDFIKVIFEDDNLNEYKRSNIEKLVNRLISYLSRMEQHYLLPKLLTFPILNNEFSNYDPISYINNNLSEYGKISIDKSVIENLFKELIKETQEKRTVAANRLTFLFDNSFLDKDQCKKFGDGLWKYQDENNFPVNTKMYQYVFLRIPHPKNVDPQAVFKKYILNIDNLPPKKNISGFSGSGNSIVYENIIKAAKYLDIKWSKSCLEYLLNLISESWDEEKRYLFNLDENIKFKIDLYYHELKKKLYNIIEINLILFSKNIELFSNENKRRLITLIKEMINLGIKPLLLTLLFKSN